MKTLYKHSRLAAAVSVGALVFSAGTAVAIAKEVRQMVKPSAATVHVNNMGRFIVTGKGASYVRPAEDMGRFVVSQNGAMFLPAASV